jgi:hypothetical protein
VKRRQLPLDAQFITEVLLSVAIWLTAVLLLIFGGGREAHSDEVVPAMRRQNRNACRRAHRPVSGRSDDGCSWGGWQMCREFI